MQGSDDERQTRSIAFLSGLVDRLEQHLQQVEEDLVKGMEERPLHGLLAAIR